MLHALFCVRRRRCSLSNMARKFSSSDGYSCARLHCSEWDRSVGGVDTPREHWTPEPKPKFQREIRPMNGNDSESIVRLFLANATQSRRVRNFSKSNKRNGGKKFANSEVRWNCDYFVREKIVEDVPEKKKNANEVEIDAWINFGEAFTVEWSLVLSLATKFGGKNEFSWKKKANDGPVLTKWVWRRSRQTAAIDIVAEREVITIGGCGRLRVACQKLDYATRSSSCFGFLSLRVQCVSSVSRCSLLRTSPYYTRNTCYAIAVLITATATDHFFFFNFPLFAWKHGKRVPK